MPRRTRRHAERGLRRRRIEQIALQIDDLGRFDDRRIDVLRRQQGRGAEAGSGPARPARVDQSKIRDRRLGRGQV